MKNLINLVVGVALLMGAARAYAQCPRAGSPYIEKLPFAAVERYLARSIAMNGLARELVTQGLDARCRPSKEAGLGQTCLDSCTATYCPGNWESDIQLLPRLNAALVQMAAGSWSHPEYFDEEYFAKPNSYLWAAKKTVSRINAAYDCARPQPLRRPIIGASVLESIDLGEVCQADCQNPGTADSTLKCDSQGGWPRCGELGVNSGANRVRIPVAVIQEFSKEIPPAERLRYLDTYGNPRATVYFDARRFATKFSDWYTPDIRKIEGKMWLFHQARLYIMAGYTSLHMGQPKAWAGLWDKWETDSACGRQKRIRYLQAFITHIRNYSAPLVADPSIRNHILLLTAEPFAASSYPGGPVQTVKMAVAPTGSCTTGTGEDKLIFDFEMANSTPLENVAPRQHTGGACATDPAPWQPIAGCADSLAYPATINPCHGANFLADGGGTTTGPYPRFYAQKAPYSIYIDHGPVVAGTPGVAAGPGTWGWDDAAWFTQALRADCREKWLLYEVQHVRTFLNSRSFLNVPGMLINGDYLLKGTLRHMPNYHMAKEPAVEKAMRAIWQVRMPGIDIANDSNAVQLIGQGTPATAPAATDSSKQLFRRDSANQRLPRFILSVTNPDCTSIYTWHIRGPYGWEPIGYGLAYEFRPPHPGAYIISLRQDNLGLPVAGNTQHGARYLQAVLTVAAGCCRASPRPTSVILTAVAMRTHELSLAEAQQLDKQLAMARAIAAKQ